MDWLTIWGVKNSIGFFFKEILILLSRDGAKDYTQVLFKDYINDDLELSTLTNLQVVTGQLIKEFLALFQQELEDAELSNQELESYGYSIKYFIFEPYFQAILNNSLKSSNLALDSNRIQQLWSDLELLALPNEFAWQRICKRFSRRVKLIWQQIEEAKSIDIDLLDTGNQNNSQLIKYKKLIQDYYGNLRLDSLDTSGAAYDELKLWRIFIAQNVREVREFIPQVYEIPKEHQKMLRESGQLDEEELNLKELEEYNEFYSQQPLRSVLEVIAEPEDKQLVILGDPGSGKSTLLQYIALQWAELPDKELATSDLPLLIELRTYNREKQAEQCHNLLEFFNSGSSIIFNLDRDYIQDKLKTGQATILFDGLDEVFEPSQREEVIAEIIQCTQDYPEARVIVTSRVIGYKQKTLAQKGFTHFMLQDLETAQVDDFINRWHDLTFYDRIDKERKRDRLKKAITESPAIQELSGNPLLLTMMAILNRNQELPRDRAELYNQSSRVLLHQWDTERALEDARLKPISLDYKDKQAMLRQVAYFMQAKTQGLVGNSITSSNLKRILSEYLATLSTTQDVDTDDIAEVLIHQLRTRNFILCFLGADYYAFVHRTFLEYFCAWEFVWQFEKTREIDFEDLINNVFGAHWQDESWHEVLRLITGMVDTKFGGEIIDFLMQQKDKSCQYANLLIAAKCLSEVRNKTAISYIATKLLNYLKKLVDGNIYLNNWGGILYAIASGCKDDPETLFWLKQQISYNENYLSFNNNHNIRAHALQAISKVFTGIDILDFLKKIAKNDSQSNVRQIAIKNIIRKWKNHSETLDFLKKIAKNDKSPEVIISVIKEFSKTKKDKSVAFELLKNSIQFNKSPTVFKAVIKEFFENWIDHAEAFSIIKKIAISDNNDSRLRITAIEELINGWKDHPEAFSIIKKIADSDYNNLVKNAAIKELTKEWKDHSETYNIIKKNAIYNNSSWIRSTAIRELINGWKDNFETFDLIKNIAISDNHDTRARNTAIAELANKWSGDLEVFKILLDRAINDPYKRRYNFEINPRQLALKIIIEQYKDCPEVLPLLRDRAENDPDEKVREYAKEQLANLTQDSKS